MNTDETNTEDFKNKSSGDYSHIKGWGVDADPKNDPTYPMRKRKNAEHEGYSWDRPQQQEKDIEVLKSVERPNISATFGTSAPPGGLSGIIRRMAFKKGESSYGHWLPLVLADRVEVYEGIIDDLKRGYIPNTFAERGWKAEWKHNRKSFIIKLAATALVATAVVGVLIASRNNDDENDYDYDYEG